MLRAVDPDYIAEVATGVTDAEVENVPPEKIELTRQRLIEKACAPFDKVALRDKLENLKRESEQAIHIFTPDEVLSQGFDASAKEKAAGLVDEFRTT